MVTADKNRFARESDSVYGYDFSDPRIVRHLSERASVGATASSRTCATVVGRFVGVVQARRPMAANKKDGVIVNVGSRGAWRGEEGQVGYGASKAGTHALSRSLARELGPHGVRVHALAPGFIETAMARPHLQGTAGVAVRAQSPLNRVATVAEVARAILWLASNYKIL